MSVQEVQTLIVVVCGVSALKTRFFGIYYLLHISTVMQREDLVSIVMVVVDDLGNLVSRSVRGVGRFPFPMGYHPVCVSWVAQTEERALKPSKIPS